MTQDDSVIKPIPISCLAHSYYIYDIDHVTLIRREHNIPGILIGTLPQSPQQNVFLGLPLELLSEEARLLVKKGVAYIVDDSELHRNGLRNLSVDDRRLYMRVLDAQGEDLQRAASDLTLAKKEQIIKNLPEHKQAKVRAAIEREKQRQNTDPEPESTDTMYNEDDISESLFSSSQSSSRGQSTPSYKPKLESTTDTSKRLRSVASATARKTYHVTPTLSNPPFPSPPPSSLETHSNADTRSSSKSIEQTRQPLLPPVRSTSAYSLYEHLHSQSYFLSSGLRFGAQYSVYPGDPLRFHAHFLARGYDWDEDIDLLSLVGGGRLGTGVKKSYLIGGPVHSVASDSERDVNSSLECEGDEKVRCFSIEWAGM